MLSVESFYTVSMQWLSVFSRSSVLTVWFLLGGSLMMVPFWVMLITSLTPADIVFSNQFNGVWAWPLTVENLQQLFHQVAMSRYVLNSVLIALITTVLHVLFCAMAGYAFSRLRFKGRNVLFFAVLMTMMVPPQVNIVPLFMLMKQFGWVNTYWALIVPGLFGGFGVFLFRQWFNGLPQELEEAATLDGCSTWRTFWSIALPLAGPPMATLALFVFISSWNGFLWPLIVTHSDSLRTLPVGLAALKESFRDTTNWPLLMSAATVSVLPVVAVFLAGQRYLLQGLMAGSVKE